MKSLHVKVFELKILTFYEIFACESFWAKDCTVKKNKRNKVRISQSFLALYTWIPEWWYIDVNIYNSGKHISHHHSDEDWRFRSYFICWACFISEFWLWHHFWPLNPRRLFWDKMTIPIVFRGQEGTRVQIYILSTWLVGNLWMFHFCLL